MSFKVSDFGLKYIKRRDATSVILLEKISAHSLLSLTPEELLERINDSRSKNNWLDLVSFGVVSISETPFNNKTACLAVLDGLIRLNFFESFFLFSNDINSDNVDPLNISRRKLALAWKVRDFKKCISIGLQYKDDKFHVRTALEASIIINDYSNIETFIETKLTEGNPTDLVRQKIDWCNFSETNIDTEPKIIKTITSALNDKNFKLAFSLLSLALQSGYKSKELFVIAVQSYDGESYLSDRVAHARTLAYENFNNDSFFTEQHVDFLCKIKDFERAFELLLRHYLCGNTQKNITFRLEVLRRALYPFLNPFFPRLDEKEFYKGDRLAAFNFFKLSGEETIADIYQSRLDKHYQNSCFFGLHDLPPLPTSVKKPKIAICISGQLRSFEKNWETIYERLVQPYNADVFISTWDEQVHGTDEIRALHRTLGKELVKYLPNDLKVVRNFKKTFPKTFSLLSSSKKTRVVAENLLKLKGVIRATVSNAAEFDLKHKDSSGLYFADKLNQAKMFYTIYQCNQNRILHEQESKIQYDVVIRIRPDLDIDIPEIEQYFEKVMDDASTIYTSYLHYDGCGDQFAIGSAHAMTIFSAIWSNLEKYKTFKYFESLTGRVAEHLLGEHLFYSGVSFQELHCKNATLSTELPIEYLDIRDTLKTDILNCDRSDTSAFYDRVDQWYNQPKSLTT